MSSSEPVISVRNVGKAYRIFSRPSDRLRQAFSLRRRSLAREHWALRGVSFDVMRGDSVGILGRNGSGKSTLLQLIAKTLSSTEGTIDIRGRVAPLLELGSGFNHEFTGRENVFLNGTILGLSKAELEKKYQWIADFADIGEYINEPVKTYSSGMYARLAFAVAAAVEPDVLVVDEILSVGDIGFQQKCMAWMREQRERGMTLLFVTHSPDAVRSLCKKAVFLVDGQISFLGPAEPAVDKYLEYVRIKANEEVLKRDPNLDPQVASPVRLEGGHRYGSGHAELLEVDLHDQHGASCRAVAFGDWLTLSVSIRAKARLEGASVSFLIRDMTGVDLFGTTTFDEGMTLPPMNAGDTHTVQFRFQTTMRAGSYGVCVAATRVTQRDYADALLLDQQDAVLAFTVIGNPNRPVHYKVWHPITVSLAEKSAVPSKVSHATS